MDSKLKNDQDKVNIEDINVTRIYENKESVIRFTSKKQLLFALENNEVETEEGGNLVNSKIATQCSFSATIVGRAIKEAKEKGVLITVNRKTYYSDQQMAMLQS